MSIRDKITLLQNAKENISTAIINKGGTVAAGSGFNSFAAAIATIPNGYTSYPYIAETYNSNNDPVTVVFHDVPKVRADLYSSDTPITSVTFNGAPRVIDSAAFTGCSNLTTISCDWYYHMVPSAPWGATNATITYKTVGGAYVFNIHIGDTSLTLDSSGNNCGVYIELLGGDSGDTDTYIYWDYDNYPDSNFDEAKQVNLHKYTAAGDYTIKVVNAKNISSVFLGRAASLEGDNPCITFKSDTAKTYPNYLKSVTLPEGMTTTRQRAFASSHKLTSIILPSTLGIIGDYTFAYNENITSLVIPANVRQVGTKAFRECKGLKSLIFKGKPNSIGTDAFSTLTVMPDYGIKVPWAEGEVSGAPWGATSIIQYNYKS